MVAVIGLSILFNIPRYLDDHVVRKPDGSLKAENTYLGNDDTFQLVYAGLIYYIVIYALPVIILAAMTYLIFVLSLTRQTSGYKTRLQRDFVITYSFFDLVSANSFFYCAINTALYHYLRSLLFSNLWYCEHLCPAAMTYRLITAIRQFYKRREQVTKKQEDE